MWTEYVRLYTKWNVMVTVVRGIDSRQLMFNRVTFIECL
jgi:hypothetical protein